MAAKRKTRADLERENMELRAQLVYEYHFAVKELQKADDRLMGSGVILRLTALGGREIINPVLIRNGLSDETIAALKKDLCRSYADATVLRP